jgi:hypothetical protein
MPREGRRKEEEVMQAKTMTLNLTQKEMNALDELSQKKRLRKTAMIKQCLRVYQAIEMRLERGEKIFFEDHKKDKAELVPL